jgi:hypothetical protein
VFNLLSELNASSIRDNLLQPNETLSRILLVIKGLFFEIDCNFFKNLQLMNIIRDEEGYQFFWHSSSEIAQCPRCGQTSPLKRGTLKERSLIGEGILGKSVTHILKLRQFLCENCHSQGNPQSFVEDISDICGYQRKTTRQLDEKMVNDAIYRSANGLASDYSGMVNISGETILNRVKEAGAMVTTKNLTDTDHVKVLSVDDNNGRKGNSSTASTVIIDAESHIILAVAEGANSGTAEQLFERFTEAQGLSRDRAGAYTKAGDNCNLKQYADVFHLTQNGHDAVKDVLSKELPHNIYLCEGEGWVGLPTSNGTAMDAETVEDTVHATMLTVEDIDLRVKLSRLTAKQEQKYRMSIELLQLYDQGLSTNEIIKRMGTTRAQQRNLLRDLADTINGVEDKIDRNQEYIPVTLRQNTTSENPKKSSKSIVAPYGDTVMRMVEEGHTQRTIYPVIKEMGFGGCEKTIYHYISKRRNEDSVKNLSIGLTEDISENSAIRRPPRVSMKHTTKTMVYRFVLHEVSEERKKQNGCNIEVTAPIPAELLNEAVSENTSTKRQNSFLSEEMAGIIMGKKPEKGEELKKKK